MYKIYGMNMVSCLVFLCAYISVRELLTGFYIYSHYSDVRLLFFIFYLNNVVVVFRKNHENVSVKSRYWFEYLWSIQL